MRKVGKRTAAFISGFALAAALIFFSKPLGRVFDSPAVPPEASQADEISIPEVEIEAKVPTKDIIAQNTKIKIQPRHNEDAQGTATSTPDFAEAVLQGLNSYKTFLQRCYAKHLRQKGPTGGKIELNFRIEANGKVGSIEVIKSTFKNLEIQKCVASVIRRARFKRPKDGPIQINYPIYFN